MWKKGNCHVEQDFAHTSTRRASFNEQVRPANGHATVTSRRQSLFPFNDCSLFIERAHTIPRPYPGGMHASGRVPNFPHEIFVCFCRPQGAPALCRALDTCRSSVDNVTHGDGDRANVNVDDSLSLRSSSRASRRDKKSRRFTYILLCLQLDG